MIMATNNIPQNISIDVDSISLNNSATNPQANVKNVPEVSGQPSRKGKKGTGTNGSAAAKNSQINQLPKKSGVNVRGNQQQRGNTQTSSATQNVETNHNASHISRESKTGTGSQQLPPNPLTMKSKSSGKQ